VVLVIGLGESAFEVHFIRADYCDRDEVLYQAKFHPEQYSDTFTTEQIQQLHKSIYYVCSTAIDALADMDKFPEDWLFKHRWGKGKKGATNALSQVYRKRLGLWRET
jgi:formamidopyrimidine-DNA glycosylase